MFKIALAQTNVHPGNPRQNTAVMKECIAKAKAAGCDLIVLDCMGFSAAHTAVARAACARPILLAQSVLAHTAAMLLVD